VTSFPFKVTLPAPSYFYTSFISCEATAYADREALVRDVVEIEKVLVAEAIAAGARWIQFDFPLYPALVGANVDALRRELGESRESLLTKAIQADAAVTEAIAPGTVVALHLCRGNLEGGFWNGSLAPI